MNGTIHSSNPEGSKWCSLWLKILKVSSTTMWSQQVAVNEEYYQVLPEHYLHAAVWHKCPHFIIGAPLLVLQDKACCHVARPVQDLLAWWQRETLEHSPYSTTMNECTSNFYMFPKMKESLRGKWFCSVGKVMQAVGQTLASINRNRFANVICCLP
jgi:hypothetical protein